MCWTSVLVATGFNHTWPGGTYMMRPLIPSETWRDFSGLDFVMERPTSPVWELWRDAMQVPMPSRLGRRRNRAAGPMDGPGRHQSYLEQRASAYLPTPPPAPQSIGPGKRAPKGLRDGQSWVSTGIDRWQALRPPFCAHLQSSTPSHGVRRSSKITNACLSPPRGEIDVDIITCSG